MEKKWSVEKKMLEEKATSTDALDGFRVVNTCEDGGVVFEIDDAQMWDRIDNKDDDELLKYAKYELLGSSDESDEEEQQQEKILTSSFEKLSKQMVDVMDDGLCGVLKSIVREGDGVQVPPDAQVTFRYNGYLEHSTKPFDSSALRGNRSFIKLSNNEIIPGLEIGIKTMKVNEKSLLLIQPHLAYGLRGCPPRIPPNSTVLFEVEVIKFTTCCVGVDKQNISFGKLIELCGHDHQAGNCFFKRGQLPKAAFRYERALQQLEEVHLQNAREEKQCKILQETLLVNLAIVNDKQRKFHQAATFAKRALAINMHNAKALFRLGRCQNELGAYRDAKDSLLRARHYLPNNEELTNELKNLEQNIVKERAREKLMCAKMMSQK